MHFDLKKKTALVAATAAIAIAGCGGGDELSEEDYATEVGEILTTFGEESVSLGTELSTATDPEELQTGVAELEEITQTAVDELNDIEPPSDASEGHDTLVGALEGYLSDIQTLSEAVDTDDPQEAQQAALDFQKAALDVQSELQEAATQLQDAGIEAPSE